MGLGVQDSGFNWYLADSRRVGLQCMTLKARGGSEAVSLPSGLGVWGLLKRESPGSEQPGTVPCSGSVDAAGSPQGAGGKDSARSGV